MAFIAQQGAAYMDGAASLILERAHQFADSPDGADGAGDERIPKVIMAVSGSVWRQDAAVGWRVFSSA